MTAKKSRPRGRPPLAPSEKKRRNFTFRSTDELHEALSKASAASGRSLSEEIEWRVGQSFFMQDVVRMAVSAAIEKTLAYVDERLAKEEAERNRRSDFSKALSGKPEDEK
jgi:hypothetical protein